MEGRGEKDMSELGGQTLLEDSRSWVLADTAIQIQETQVKEKGTHENNANPDLGSSLFYVFLSLRKSYFIVVQHVGLKVRK